MPFTKTLPSSLGSTFSSFHAVVEDSHQLKQRAMSFKAPSSCCRYLCFISN